MSSSANPLPNRPPNSPKPSEPNPPKELPPKDLPKDLKGLTPEEYHHITASLGRPPNETELAIFSAMYSEHCCYKSSAIWLAKLPTKNPSVVCGPGENAGIIRLGDGLACAFKVESHNHPSYIEPFQGAATGVGGILRDIFTMGARPVALLNSIHFGTDRKKPFYLKRVVAGIAHYGNCIGIPTVGGECHFAPSYNGNILVNAMAVGLVAEDKIFYSSLKHTKNLAGAKLVYVGAKTGRDGIAGAVMASASFGKQAAARSTVQVGDPFAGKLLMEACLELMASEGILAVQDMGAAGLTSSTFEMAAKSRCGAVLELANIPLREAAMAPAEIMLSESQERMLFILTAKGERNAKAIFKKWGLDSTVIGSLQATPNVVVKMNGKTVADLPTRLVVDEAPRLHRSFTPPATQKPKAVATPAHRWSKIAEAMLSHLSSRKEIWQQYDYGVGTNTLRNPGGDAAVVAVANPNASSSNAPTNATSPSNATPQKALALSLDSNARWAKADPKTAAIATVAEGYRNLCSVGAKPLAITNCLNFGNPTDPRIMGQFVAATEGIGEACLGLGLAVVSGNVSLYNQTDNQAIDPTAVIGTVGLVADTKRLPKAQTSKADRAVVLVGKPLGDHNLGGSLYEELFLKGVSAPPAVDLKAEKNAGELMVRLVAKGLVEAVHDISAGGLLVALAEFVGTAGIEVEPSPNLSHKASLLSWLAGEEQGRYLVATTNLKQLQTEALEYGIPATAIGKTTEVKPTQTKGGLSIKGVLNLTATELTKLLEKPLV